ncbi:hypothetical protein AB0A05_26950 [Streptomyces sp. NPDC046374]|uniref:hypothetical protein n=1 Tax=Streptomyces sp. NPDC046374 TaxID=3154917 RepID=UPI0033E4E04C
MANAPAQTAAPLYAGLRKLEAQLAERRDALERGRDLLESRIAGVDKELSDVAATYSVLKKLALMELPNDHQAHVAAVCDAEAVVKEALGEAQVRAIENRPLPALEAVPAPRAEETPADDDPMSEEHGAMLKRLAPEEPQKKEKKKEKEKISPAAARRERVTEILAASGEPMTARQVAEALGHSGTDRTRVEGIRTLLNSMLAKADIVRAGRGLYAATTGC